MMKTMAKAMTTPFKEFHSFFALLAPDTSASKRI